MSNEFNYTAEVIECESGGFIGFLKEDPDVFSFGNSHKELIENLSNSLNAMNEAREKLKKEESELFIKKLKTTFLGQRKWISLNNLKTNQVLTLN